MNVAPSEPGDPGVEPNAENLDGVLGRFQDWARARRDQPISKCGAASGQGAGARKANLAGGTRELSYEQALRASSYRRPEHPVASEISAQALKPQPAANPPAESPEPDATTNVGGPSITARVAKPRPAAPAETSNTADSRRVRAGRSKTSTPMQTAKVAASVPRLSQPATAAGVEGPPSGGGSERRNRGRITMPKSQVRSGNARRLPRPSPEPGLSIVPPLTAGTRPETSTPNRPPQRAQPAFREVFKATAGLAATAKPDAIHACKSIALSLRVSDAEQARIQACAARASLSVSAYLRQCALGVDELRDQVELALDKLHQQDTKFTAPPGLAAIPGILGRFASHWFHRLRGHDDYMGISLR